ncbi:MAG: hypothetical protein JO086_04815 [Acidimicrobiia bacterium]|nr:hypothetical protein [Acidimicrobiia bacterium]
MELHRYLSILRRRLVVVVLAVLVCAAAAWAATPKKAQYSAQSVIYIGAQKYALNPGGGAAQYTIDPTLVVKNIMSTYQAMLHSEPIASDAIQLAHVPLSSDEVLSRTTVAPDKDTQLLDVTVKDDIPERARRLADSLSQAFVSKIQSLDTSSNAPVQEGTLPGVPAYVFERAKLPSQPDSSGLARNMVLGGLFGLMTSIGIVFLLEYLDLTIKSPAEAERRLQLPVLAVIPFDRDHPDVDAVATSRSGQEPAPARSIV